MWDESPGAGTCRTVQVLCGPCTGPVQGLYKNCAGPVRILYRARAGARADSLYNSYHGSTGLAQAPYKNRAGPVQVLCRACAGPVQDLCKTVGHICPSRPLSVKLPGGALTIRKWYIWSARPLNFGPQTRAKMARKPRTD